MDPITLIVVCLLVGFLLLAAELLIPSGGLIGLSAAALFLVAIVAGFAYSPWLGVGLMLLLLVASRFVFGLMMKLWQKTPVGKAVILDSEVAKFEKPRAQLDAVGRTVTTLRPMGEAEFGTQTFEVISELGPLAPGSRVRVVGHRDDGVAVVRPE